MPQVAQTNFPTLLEIMNLARSIVMDTAPGATDTPGEGSVLTDDPAISPFTIPYLRSAIRSLYRDLGNTGVATVIKDNVIIYSLTPVNGAQGLGNVDPASQVSLSYVGYFDGTNTNSNTALPGDVLTVDEVWERQHGTNNKFVLMKQSQFGLPSRYQLATFCEWEYRGDAIWMVGSTQTNDLRLRYHASLPLPGDAVDFASTTVPILDSVDALAYKVAAMFTATRGSLNTEFFEEQYKEQLQALKLRQVRRQQTVDYNRIPYGADGFWR